MNQHVISQVVAHELCSGCGVCSGVCPRNILQMNKQSNGDLAPDLVGECPPKCVLCLNACPFAENPDDVTTLARERFDGPDILHHEAVGYYLKNYVGYSKQHRAIGASGGTTTWLLEVLLAEGHVDAVVAVARGDGIENGEKLFHMQEMTTAEEISNAAGSFYYPISIDTPLRRIQELKGSKRYAIVGLPCTLKGIALAMRKMPSLRKGIRFMFGLVCGHLPNYYYTEYLATLGGSNPKHLRSVTYRGKNPKEPANNYFFQAVTRNGNGQPQSFHGEVSSAWTSRMFQLNACNFCDDLFAEVADASFMDAWLPEYIKDSRGHSIVVVRNPLIRTLIEKSITRNQCSLQEIAVEKILRSQEAQWKGKSQRLRAQLVLAEITKRKVPLTRQVACMADYRNMRLEIGLQNAIQNNSKAFWPRRDKDSPKWLYYKLLIQMVALKVLQAKAKLLRVLAEPRRVVDKIKAKK